MTWVKRACVVLAAYVLIAGTAFMAWLKWLSTVD